MSEPLKGAVRAAVLRLLEPLMKLLLDAGVGVGDFIGLAKVAYVRAASRRGQIGSKEIQRPTVSQIAVVTGMTRVEIAAILATGESVTRTTEHNRQRAERVLSGWWTDPAFLTPQGEPAILLLRGGRRSFEALCRRYSGEYRAAPVLEELSRVRAIRRLPDGRVQALSRTYATVRWDPEGIAAVGEQLAEHCASLVANLEQPNRPRLARQVVNARLNPRYAPVLIRDIENSLQVQADALDDNLNDPLHTAEPGAPAMRLGVGLYVFEGPADDSAEPDTVAPPAEPPREARGKRRG
ncbi:MAG: DUF6502 family protein [Steroidobacteraceae bacterium]